MSFSYDLGDDIFTSEIRTGPTHEYPLIEEWDVSKKEGSNNTLILSLDDSKTSGITHVAGWMDVKRVSFGEPLPVLRDPIQVVFIEQITI